MISAQCPPCTSLLPQCLQGMAQEPKGFPDTVQEPLHLSVGNRGPERSRDSHRATHRVTIETRHRAVSVLTREGFVS